MMYPYQPGDTPTTEGDAMATTTDNKAEVEAALAKLHDAVTAVTTGEDWTAWLKFLNTMHNYSPLNRLWMWAQWEGRREVQAIANFLSGGAIEPLPAFSMPAAFSAWKDKGRMVRKGEKALTVLAPIVVTDKDKPKVNGKPATKVIGFRLKSRTFDVSQTEGKDVPANPVSCERLHGAGDAAAFAALVDVATLNGWTVTDEMPAHYPAECNGVCVWGTKTLHVRGGLSGAQRLKTLVHELAHSLLHSPDEYDRAHRDAMNVAEVEAESVAFVVADSLGLDSSAYSIGYVASWSGGDGALIARTAERVTETAHRILTALESGALPAARGAARPKKDETPAEVAA